MAESTFNPLPEDPTPEEIETYLLQDGGRVPGGIYGTTTRDCVPVALAAIAIVAGETGEPITQDGVDHIMGLVVNSHQDPGYLIANYGKGYGFVPEDLLDDPEDYLQDEDH